MKQIHEKVNLIPVIAKADTLTKDETVLFKKRVSMSRSREGGGGGGIQIKIFPSSRVDSGRPGLPRHQDVLCENR